MRRIVIIIQARLGSSRLPGKVLMSLFPNKTALECMLERVKRSNMADKVVVATTNNPKDRELVNFLRKIKQDYSVGSENDVLDRYYQTAKKYCYSDEDVIVRLTADCPIIDPAIIDGVICFYINGKYDFASGSLEPHPCPEGMDVEVFSFKNLKRAWKEAKLPSHREHVTFYLWKNPRKFKIGKFGELHQFARYRLTLDYKEDYRVLRKVYSSLYPKKKNFNLYDIVEFLQKNPEIDQLNSSIVKNQGWIPSLKADKKFKINK